jgi:sec-independent protein translocase protein TatC
MGLLTRGPRKRAQVTTDETRMSVVEHLEALRRGLIISAIAWAAASVVAWFFTVEILQFLQHRAGVGAFQYLGPTGAFMLRFKIALFAGTFLASPVIIWQSWWFVSPGLHVHEKRVVLPMILATSFFFVLGVGFCFYSLPLILHVLNGFAPSGVLNYLPVGDDFIGFLLGLCIAFGIVFELPVILWTLGMLRIISSAWLWKNRLYWILGLGLLSNLMTPGADPLTPLIVFVPLVMFWGGTTLLLRVTGR